MTEMTPSRFGSFVKTTTRPVLTIMGFGAYIMFIKWGVLYPSEFKWVVIVMVLEWFGERALSRFSEMIGKK